MVRAAALPQYWPGAAAIGRVGGILAPTLVGILLARQGDFSDIFLMFTGVMVGAALIVAVLGPETKGLRLDEISKASD